MAERRKYDCCIHYNYHDGPDSDIDSDHCLSESFLDTLRRKLLDLGLIYLDFNNLTPGTSVPEAHTEDFINNCYKLILVLTEGFTKSHKRTYFAQLGMEDKISKGETKDVLALAVGIGKDQCKKYGLSVLKILYFEEDASTWEDERNWSSVAQFFEDPTGERSGNEQMVIEGKLAERGLPSYINKWISIEDGSTGNSYDNLFGKCFHDTNIERVNIEEPFIRNKSQIDNFESFCELVLMKKALGLCNVKVIELLTVKVNSEAKERTEKMRKSLRENGISLEIKFDKDLHDRHISFNTSPVISLGRGLDIYKTEEKDQNSRQCKKTSIFILPSTTKISKKAN